MHAGQQRVTVWGEAIHIQLHTQSKIFGDVHLSLLQSTMKVILYLENI